MNLTEATNYCLMTPSFLSGLVNVLIRYPITDFLLLEWIPPSPVLLASVFKMNLLQVSKYCSINECSFVFCKILKSFVNLRTWFLNSCLFIRIALIGNDKLLLNKLSGITRNSQSPDPTIKVIFSLSFLANVICQYPLRKSSVETILDLIHVNRR